MTHAPGSGPTPTEPDGDHPAEPSPGSVESLLERFIFASRWIQAPLYVGLILAMVVYACVFCMQLIDVCANLSSFGDVHAEERVMLGVLTLVDITMVANLVVMVVIGGYATFVSRLDLLRHADRPDWLEKINAGTMKIKLTSSLVGISAIHLLKSFIDIEKVEPSHIQWQVIIHVVFLLSGLLLALTERVLHPTESH